MVTAPSQPCQCQTEGAQKAKHHLRKGASADSTLCRLRPITSGYCGAMPAQPEALPAKGLACSGSVQAASRWAPQRPSQGERTTGAARRGAGPRAERSGLSRA